MGTGQKIFSSLLFLLLTLWLPVAGHADNTFVIDLDAGTGGKGALFTVDPVSGARTLLSDFGAGPNLGLNPYGVAVYRQQTAVPTMNEWGMIVFMFIAGLGGVQYLRRQKRA